MITKKIENLCFYYEKNYDKQGSILVKIGPYKIESELELEELFASMLQQGIMPEKIKCFTYKYDSNLKPLDFEEKYVDYVARTLKEV